MRQYITGTLPDKNGLLSITGKDFRYMRQVLRLSSGDMIDVRLPDGSLQSMTVCTVSDDRHSIILQVCDGSPITDKDILESKLPESSAVQSIRFHLIQFIPRPQKMDLIVRQAVECGIQTVLPVKGEYSQESSVMASGKRETRIERIIKEARQQSGSPVDTQVLSSLSLEDAIQWWQRTISQRVEKSAAFVLYERNKNTKSLYKYVEQNFTAQQQIKEKDKIKDVAIVVGCEGGISPSEIALLEKADFTPIHFATNILRCETAALYGIAAVQSVFTELL